MIAFIGWDAGAMRFADANHPARHFGRGGNFKQKITQASRGSRFRAIHKRCFYRVYEAQPRCTKQSASARCDFPAFFAHNRLISLETGQNEKFGRRFGRRSRTGIVGAISMRQKIAMRDLARVLSIFRRRSRGAVEPACAAGRRPATTSGRPCPATPHTATSEKAVGRPRDEAARDLMRRRSGTPP